jgi:hypothetical protein
MPALSHLSFIDDADQTAGSSGQAPIVIASIDQLIGPISRLRPSHMVGEPGGAPATHLGMRVD